MFRVKINCELIVNNVIHGWPVLIGDWLLNLAVPMNPMTPSLTKA